MHKNIVLVGPLVSVRENEKSAYRTLVSDIDDAFKVIGKLLVAPKVNLQFHRGYRGSLVFDNSLTAKVATNKNHAEFVSRVSRAFDEFESHELKLHASITVNYRSLVENNAGKLSKVGIFGPSARRSVLSELDANGVRIIKPFWAFNNIVLPSETYRAIQRYLILIENEELVYEKWNLQEVDLFPKCALNFYGPPGTGKTMAAHAVAMQLRKQLMLVSISEIESKYVGESAKNILEIFELGNSTGTILFFDEADAILGKRISSISQGSEQAINSLRSQVLTSLDAYAGIIIFSTNMIESYDVAFHSRITNIKFHLPNKEERARIWEKHLSLGLPISPTLDYVSLADASEGFSGRDIKNSVLYAVGEMLLDNKQVLGESQLMTAISHKSK